MLRDRLAGHVQPLAQLAKRLAVPLVQPVQQLPAARIRQSAKHSIVHAGNMEPRGCLTMGTYRLPVKQKFGAHPSTARSAFS